MSQEIKIFLTIFLLLVVAFSNMATTPAKREGSISDDDRIDDIEQTDADAFVIEDSDPSDENEGERSERL